MKYLFFILVFYISCITNCYAQTVSFTETTYNFGERSEEAGAFYHDFHFINTGDKVLIIKDVVPGPGCTVSGWESTYEPGESGVVRITYHPENRIKQDVVITSQIVTNVGGTPYGLTITGKIKLLKHTPINYFKIEKGNKKSVVDRVPQDDYELILKRYVDSLVNTTVDLIAGINLVPYYVSTMNRDGSWACFDYDNKYVADWEPQYHLGQILRMSYAYALPISDYYGNDILYNAIMQGLKFWYQKNPTSRNWYANQITAPSIITKILAVMEFGITKTETELELQLLERINNSDPGNQTSSGKVKLGMIHLIRGCLLKDYELVNYSASQLFDPVKITEKEGIQRDMSYLDHGRQLYIGGYGCFMIEGVVNTMNLLYGTRFAMPQEKMALLSDYVRGTYLNTYRSCYIDYSVLGRSIAIENSLLNKNEPLLRNLIKFDYNHSPEYQDILYRFDTGDATFARTNRNQNFYMADYMLHNRKNYDFSVRCVSTRTIHDEAVNGEGLLSTYLAEGANNIRVFGDEYYNIFPVWEWDKIPGTTTPQGEARNTYVEDGERGHSSFVGGASDGKYGVMTYLMDDHGIKAHKGWFLFDEEIVCLGCGIENNTSKAVNTSINQCHLKGPLLLLSNQRKVKKEIAEVDSLFDYKGFIWHNNIAYYLPNNTLIHLKAGNQEGSWNKINYNLSSSIISLPVFNLYIEHCFDKKKDSYEYILIPGKTKEQLKKYKPENIQVLSNSDTLQAVYNKKLDVLQAIFYEPASIKVRGKTLTVMHPCTVIVTRLKSSKPKLMITDPTQEFVLNEGRDCVISN